MNANPRKATGLDIGGDETDAKSGIPDSHRPCQMQPKPTPTSATDKPPIGPNNCQIGTANAPAIARLARNRHAIKTAVIEMAMSIELWRVWKQLGC
nr:hypothetical protein [uncultured Rhodoferax sp.]